MAPLQALRNRLQVGYNGDGGTPHGWVHEEELTDPVIDAFQADEERGDEENCPVLVSSDSEGGSNQQLPLTTASTSGMGLLTLFPFSKLTYAQQGYLLEKLGISMGVTEGDRIGLVQELRTMHAEELVQILQGVIERVQAKKPSKKQALAWLSRQGDLTPAK